MTWIPDWFSDIFASVLRSNMYRNHLNTKLVSYSNGRFVWVKWSGIGMVVWKPGWKKLVYAPKCPVLEWSTKNLVFRFSVFRWLLYSAFNEIQEDLIKIHLTDSLNSELRFTAVKILPFVFTKKTSLERENCYSMDPKSDHSKIITFKNRTFWRSDFRW